MQYRRTHMDAELTVDYDNTINSWRRYTIDRECRRQVNVDGVSARRRNFNRRYLQDKSI